MPQVIYIVNKSTRVSNDDVATMTRAVAQQMGTDVAPAFNAQVPSVIYGTDENQAPPGSWVIAVLDNSDQAGALGWHTEDDQGRIFGRVFAGPCLDDGKSTALAGKYAVSSVLSHEVIEAFGDPYVNFWATRTDNVEVAYELCDAVEGDGYTITDHQTGQSVMVSNFLYPAAFNANASASTKFDHLNLTTKPFELRPGGYNVVRDRPGNEQQVFGDEFPEWKKETKKSPFARGERRTKGK